MLAFGAAEVWAFSVVEFVVFLLVFLLLVESRKHERTKTRKEWRDKVETRD